LQCYQDRVADEDLPEPEIGGKCGSEAQENGRRPAKAEKRIEELDEEKAKLVRYLETVRAHDVIHGEALGRYSTEASHTVERLVFTAFLENNPRILATSRIEDFRSFMKVPTLTEVKKVVASSVKRASVFFVN